jgi:ABC-type thiamin/hydroxymethylpyrimidine transport system permease subunit
MAYMIAFHWGWLLASLVLGFCMGWVAVVTHARPVSNRGMIILAVLAAALVALAATQVIPGRFGYWLDLLLIMFVPYLIGCAIGSQLRDWVVTRAMARR